MGLLLLNIFMLLYMNQDAQKHGNIARLEAPVDYLGTFIKYQP